MNETTYKNAFGEKANQNANILTLKNHSDKNVEKTASQFMKLDSVRRCSEYKSKSTNQDHCQLT